MYLWKCWHDSRDRVVLYSLACLVAGAGAGLGAIAWARWVVYGLILSPWYRQQPDPFRWVWVGTLGDIQDYMNVAVVWAGMSLGATSVGREYSSGAMPFLLTRPSKRRRIIWVDWCLGMAEIFVLLFMFFVGSVPLLVYATKSFHWLPGVLLLVMLVVAAVLYSLTHFTTTVTGSSMKGLSLSAAVVLFYVLFPTAMNEWWHVRGLLRIKDWTFQIFDWLYAGQVEPHWEVMTLWAGAALIFPLLSQLWLERREV